MAIESKLLTVAGHQIQIKTDLPEEELNVMIQTVESFMNPNSRVEDKKKEFIITAMSLARELIEAKKENKKLKEFVKQIEYREDYLLKTLSKI